MHREIPDAKASPLPSAVSRQPSAAVGCPLDIRNWSVIIPPNGAARANRQAFSDAVRGLGFAGPGPGGPHAAEMRLSREVEMGGDTPDRTRSRGNQPHIVIAYSGADHEFAGRLTSTLRQDGITRWIDDVDMSAGVPLVNWIANASRPVDCVVPTISAASAWSNWVQHELRAVITRSPGAHHVLVLPARIDSSRLPEFLACHPYIDFHRNGWGPAYGDLVLAVQQRADGPRPPMST